MPNRRIAILAAVAAAVVAALLGAIRLMHVSTTPSGSSLMTSSSGSRLAGGGPSGSLSAAGTSGMTASQIQGLVSGTKLINYFPSAAVSQGMWWNWNPTTVNADMGKIASLGANTVRLFVYPQEFGYPTPISTFTKELSQAVQMASSHGLKVVLSLFNAYAPVYTDLPGSEQWASSILAPYRGNSEISYVELQNEIDPTNSAAMTWASTMLPVLRADAARPVSVSVSGWDSPLNLGYLIRSLTNQPDIYDFHYYGPASDALSVLRTLKQWVSGAPLIIGETGYSTNPNNTDIAGVAPTVAAHEAYQSSFFQTLESDTHSLGLPPAAPWVLQDFQPTQYISPNDQDFGLLRLDGSAKPAAAVIQSAFRQG